METTTIPTKAISILLVEDDTSTLEQLGNILAKKYPGTLFYTADDGRKGLEIFQVHLQDVVITDINMPEMSGVQMIGKIRAIKPDTKFIVLTGNSGRIALEASAGDGFVVDHQIMKPIRFGTLFAAIEQCVG